MPELPEVQTIANDLIAANLVGARIRSVRVGWPRTIAGTTPRAFGRQLKGRRFVRIGRRAKYLLLGLDNGSTLLVHLRMTGKFKLTSAQTRPTKHEHVVFSLSDGRQLRFHDTRKFGRIHLTKEPEKILSQLGPEPLAKAFTASKFARMLGGRSRQLKPLLLDQTFLAGLGNIYVDEALWDAKLHPCRISSSLSTAEVRKLRRAIPKVLNRGLRNLGTSLGTGKANFYSVARRGRNQERLRVFRRTGEPCLRCGTAIQRIVVGQRSTHVCGKCQEGKRIHHTNRQDGRFAPANGGPKGDTPGMGWMKGTKAPKGSKQKRKRTPRRKVAKAQKR